MKRNPKYTHVIVNSDTICLRFVTDGEKSRAGLRATYREILSPPSGCGGDQIVRLLENERHEIKSLNYPEKYPDRTASECAWLIQADKSQDGRFQILMEFAVLQLEKPEKSSTRQPFFCDDSDRIIIYGSSSCEERNFTVILIFREMAQNVFFNNIIFD